MHLAYRRKYLLPTQYIRSLRLPGTRALHAKETIDLTVSDNEEDTQSRGQQRDTHSSVPVCRLVFDLTVETEHYTICSDILGQGDDLTSRIFAFRTHGCVRFSLYLSL
jgi:hypothetical protein